MSESKDEGRERPAASIVAAIAAVAEENLIRIARAGGTRAELAMRTLLAETQETTDAWRRGTERLRAELHYAQASIRAMVGQTQPEDPRIPIDPPAGHAWVTGGPDGPGRTGVRGRLMCITCTGGIYGGPNETPAPVVLAAECLDRASARRVGSAAVEFPHTEDVPCIACGVVH